MEEQPSDSGHTANPREGHHDHDDHHSDHHEDHGEHHHGHEQGHEQQTDIRRRGGFIITALTSGHGVFHWFTQSFIAMLPEVQAAFALSAVGVGGITATREFVSGIVTLPGGVIADALRRYWGLILALCMATFGIGWLIIGFSPSYPLLLFGMGVVAVAASIWHLPAMASLSHHFSHRRGAALSFHGVGGQLGDALAPPVTGVLLGVLAWTEIISIYAALPIFLAFVVYWSFRHIGRDSQGQQVAPTRNEQWQTTKHVLRNPVLWFVAFVGGVRGMAFLALTTFLPIYLNDLGMTPLVRNLHLGLLMAVGIVSTPVVGYLSDLFGRKVVLVPGMLFLALMSLFLGISTGGILLIVIIALLGTFLFGDQPVLTALALDVAGEGVATTVLGVLSFARFLFAASSPLIAGFIYDIRGAGAAFIYVAVLFAIGAVVLIFVPVTKTDRAAVTGHHH